MMMVGMAPKRARQSSCENRRRRVGLSGHARPARLVPGTCLPVSAAVTRAASVCAAESAVNWRAGAWRVLRESGFWWLLPSRRRPRNETASPGTSVCAIAARARMRRMAVVAL